MFILDGEFYRCGKMFRQDAVKQLILEAAKIGPKNIEEWWQTKVKSKIKRKGKYKPLSEIIFDPSKNNIFYKSKIFHGNRTKVFLNNGVPEYFVLKNVKTDKVIVFKKISKYRPNEDKDIEYWVYNSCYEKLLGTKFSVRFILINDLKTEK